MAVVCGGDESCLAGEGSSEGFDQGGSAMDRGSGNWMSDAVGVGCAVDFGPVDVGEGSPRCVCDGVENLIGDLSDEVAF